MTPTEARRGHSGMGRQGIFGDNVTLEIESAFEQSGSSIVRCRVDGDFDESKLPDPVILTYYFAVRGDLITQAIILLNSKTAL
jgi:hypothetical protein